MDTNCKFQFHKGTIRTAILWWAIRAEDEFQFHKGTIRTFLFIIDDDHKILFQFHKGTIRTITQLIVASNHVQISIP